MGFTLASVQTPAILNVTNLGGTPEEPALGFLEGQMREAGYIVDRDNLGNTHVLVVWHKNEDGTRNTKKRVLPSQVSEYAQQTRAEFPRNNLVIGHLGFGMHATPV